MTQNSSLSSIVERAEALYRDADLRSLAEYKKNGPAIGCVPAYVPTEVIEAGDALPAYLLGAAPGFEVVHGDAYFQSNICHIPRSLVDLGERGALDCLDLLVAPSTCDVIRNLTGIWQLAFPKQKVRFLDLPHRYDDVGHAFYTRELRELGAAVSDATGTEVTDDRLRAAICEANQRRAILREIEELRAREPWRVLSSEFWLMVRAGAAMRASDHIVFLRDYLDAVREVDREPLDVARVALWGAFCEQPPLGFIRTLERAGCAIVLDDLLLGMRWLADDVEESGDPFAALAKAYLVGSPPASCRYEGDVPRPEALLDLVKKRKASGLIFATPSFCDPALLDRADILSALEGAGIPCMQLQYAENSVDFGNVREQTGTFADTLRLWVTP